MPADMDEIYSIAVDNNLVVIEDCAHACGASYKQQKIGATTSYNCFSLHAVKPLAIGDGGMITTDDQLVDNMVRKGRWLGIDKSTYARSKEGQYDGEYNVTLLGYKSHMCDVMAAIGRGQLIHLDEDAKRRKEIVDRYRKNLEGIVQLMDNPNDRTSANYLFIVRFKDSKERDEVRKLLRKNEIQFGFHYTPNYVYPMYHQCLVESKRGMELYHSTAMSLPLHPYLTDDEIDFICEIIKALHL
jgi:perosamine synthetase